MNYSQLYSNRSNGKRHCDIGYGILTKAIVLIILNAVGLSENPNDRAARNSDEFSRVVMQNF